jgi:ferritin-like metal-binding protein YciE
MAGYGMVRTYAEILHRDDIAKILQETRQKENGADNKLTKLAQQINVQAKKDVEPGVRYPICCMGLVLAA